VINRRDGNTEKSRGLVIYREVNKITREHVMLRERRISSRKVGSGMIITRRIATTLPPMRMSLWSIRIADVERGADRSAFSMLKSLLVALEREEFGVRGYLLRLTTHALR